MFLSVNTYSFFLSDRNAEKEGGSIPRLSLDPDVSAVVLHDFLADGQANAHAFVFPATVQALEDAENPLAILGVDSNSVVLNRHHPFRPAPVTATIFHPNVDARRFFSSELDCIGQQVLKKLAETVSPLTTKQRRLL